MFRSQAFTLPEVLFALLILQVLLLTVVSAHTKAIQLQVNAVQRTQAVAAASDLVYSLRLAGGNTGAVSGHYSAGTVLAPVYCVPANPCSPSVVRSYLLYHWQQSWLYHGAGYAVQPLHKPQFCLQGSGVELSIGVSWRKIGDDLDTNAEESAAGAPTCLPETGRSGFRFTAYQKVL